MTDGAAHKARIVTQSAVGRSVPRQEDPALLTGRGAYVDDIALPDILHCAFVRSSVAHAMIDSIDAADARAMDGVHAVLTLPDLMPVLNSGRMPLGASPINGENSSTPFVLCNREVAYVGEAIALVVARSRYIAEDAAARVMVEMSPLPVVGDARAAMAVDSPVCHCGACFHA
jgi:carbon-monoxide dehydrogenase large subunit